jgi:hypothetical protein
MKSFGEFKEIASLKERLTPQILELLKHLDAASEEAEKIGASKTLDIIENARVEIIKLEGK